MWQEMMSSCQHPGLTYQAYKWVNLEVDPTAPVKPSDNYSASADILQSHERFSDGTAQMNHSRSLIYKHCGIKKKKTLSFYSTKLCVFVCEICYMVLDN